MAVFNIFAEQDASQAFEGLLTSISNEVKGKSADYILNVDDKEWEEYFIKKFELIPLTLYPEKASAKFAGKGKQFMEQYGRKFEVEEYKFEIHVPFTGNSDLFMMRPSTYVLRTTRVNVPNRLEGNVTGYITLIKQDKEQFEREKNSFISLIQLNVEHINKDVENFNRKIIPHFYSVLNSERERIKKESVPFPSSATT